VKYHGGEAHTEYSNKQVSSFIHEEYKNEN